MLFILNEISLFFLFFFKKFLTSQFLPYLCAKKI